jgi:hypothetical protein
VHRSAPHQTLHPQNDQELYQLFQRLPTGNDGEPFNREAEAILSVNGDEYTLRQNGGRCWDIQEENHSFKACRERFPYEEGTVFDFLAIRFIHPLGFAVELPVNNTNNASVCQVTSAGKYGEYQPVELTEKVAQAVRSLPRNGVCARDIMRLVLPHATNTLHVSSILKVITPENFPTVADRTEFFQHAAQYAEPLQLGER